MLKLTTIQLLIAIFVAISMPLNSFAVYQDDQETEEKVEFKFSDEELLGFIDSNKEISQLRKENNEIIEAVVEEHGLTMDRFNQISRAAQIGALQSGTFSDEEIDAFNAIGPKVNLMKKEMQQMIQLVLEDNNLNSAKYQEIIRNYRQDEKLQEYVREIARERAIEAARKAKREEAEKEQEENQENQG